MGSNSDKEVSNENKDVFYRFFSCLLWYPVHLRLLMKRDEGSQ